MKYPEKAPVHLETERLILREWQDSDLRHFSSINADPIIMEHFPRRLDEKASDNLVERFQEHFKKNGYGPYALVVKDSGDFIGFVGIQQVEGKFPFAPTVEIAWRIDYEHWGKGYASEAAKAVLNHAFTKLKLPEVVAYTVFDNAKSIRVMENIGMTRDPKGDFDYPALRKDHPLGKFVLYRATKKGWGK